jgi:hypothetical protein
MFAICIHVLYREGAPEVSRQIRSGFAERRDAAKFLDGMIAVRPSGAAGYNSEQNYWWTRINDVVTRYTIEPSTEAPDT